MDLSDIQISFRYGGTKEKERQEILRNVQTIISTPVGTCPLYRDFGVDNEVLDLPTNVAQNKLALEIMEAVERYEPRAAVEEVHFSANANGGMTVKVVITDG